MKHFQLKIWVVLFFHLLMCLTYAQERAYFEQYTTADGLNANMILYLTQDKNGFIWGATSNGLFRYDGHSFKKFTSDNYPGLFRDDLRRVNSMSNGRLAAGGYSGTIVMYDAKRDSFLDKTADDFYESYFKEIRGLFCSQEGKEYLYTSGGLYLYDGVKDSFVKHFPAYEAMKDVQVYSMNMDAYGRFWLGTINGLQVYDKRGVLVKNELLKTRSKTFASNVLKLDERCFLVSFMQEGLWLMRINADGSISSPHSIRTPFHNVTYLLKDRNGRVWCATDGEGLWYSDDVEKGDFVQFSPYGGYSEYEMKKIYCLLEDRSGVIWIGTHNSGLWKYSPKQLYGVVSSKNMGFPSMIVTSFCGDKDHNLLVGSDGMGLYQFSSNYKILKHWTNKNGLTSNNILSIATLDKETFDLGTWGGGICRVKSSTNEISQLRIQNIPSPTNRCVDVLPLQNGEFWVATGGDGLYHCGQDGTWNRRPLLINEKADEWMSKVVEGKDNAVWVISSTTLWRVERQSSKYMLFTPQRDKEHNPISFIDIDCDSMGNCLLATDRGLIYFSADGKTSEPLDFLPKSYYATVFFDRQGTAWACGSEGILSVNLKKRTFMRVWYDERCCNEKYFTPHSSYQDEKGKIFFGVKDGFLMFYPQEILVNPVIDYFSFSELYISGKKVKPGSDVLEDGHLSEVKKLTLPQNRTNIALSFDWVDFSGSKDMVCEYRLLGMESEWTPFEKNERTVRFSYIPAGKYELQIRQVNRDRSKTMNAIALPIEVLAPWWQTGWAMAGFFLSFCAFGLGITLFRIRNVKKRNVELSIKVEERTHALNLANKEVLSQNDALREQKFLMELKNKELDNALKSKNHLLSILAHDLKNPMFGIVGALDVLDKTPENFSEKQRKEVVSELAETSRHLQSVLVDLLEWATSQNQDMLCHPSAFNMTYIVQDDLAFFKGLAKEKEIEMSFESKFEGNVFADARMIGVVVRNLLANALKFTHRGGRIKIEIYPFNQRVALSVKDNGIGMTEEQKSLVFIGKTTTPGTDNEKGTGLGLKTCKRLLDLNGVSFDVKSEVGVGTEMTLLLPCARDVSENEELKETKRSDLPSDLDMLVGAIVLVVEDDALIRLHLRNLLEPYMTVWEAENGALALDLLANNRPDLILSDVEMPVMDGVRFSEHVRASSEMGSIPFLFLSARNTEADRIRGLLSGAVDYLSKPFDDNELLIKLNSIMLLYKNQQQYLLQNWLRKVGDRMPGVMCPNTQNEQENVLMDPLLKRIMEKVELHYKDSNFSADDLCRELGMSPSSMSRKLKTVSDKSVGVIINEYRLQMAKTLIENSDMNVSEVAYEVGFGDPHYFSRKFKSYFGCPPSGRKRV
ncbi:MAG: response regulator [Prevotellaceae bacterium]|nr:response regulator [Prevotellaceae bacterium]